MKMSLWGGIGCCLSSAILYILGKSYDSDVEFIQSTRVDQLKGLAQLLDAEKSPLVVTISGRVGSKTPIKCNLNGLTGVIVEEMAEQLFLKRTESLGTDSWIQDTALLQWTSKEVPWYLDDGTGCVRVVGARETKDFALPVESEKFVESSSWNIVGRTFDYLRGLKMLGVKRMEKVLPVGTSVTVIGEVTKDNDGTIRIQQLDEGPFLVSSCPKLIDQLVANLGKMWYKYASVSLALFGAFLIAKHAIRCTLERRRHRELQARYLAVAAKRGRDILDGNKKDDMANLCVICMDQDYNAVLIPCGHRFCCTACSSRLQANCPICRQDIEQVVKTFRA